MGFARVAVAFTLSALFALAANAKEIVIGQVTPLSGVMATTGTDLTLGARAYFDSVNARGGIHGRKIRLVVKDDAYVTEQTVRLTRELIDQDEALALIGMLGTGNVTELVKEGVLANAAIALVAPYTGAEGLRKPVVRNLFHIRAGYAEEVAAIAAQIQNVGMTRVGVFYQDDPFGLAGLAAAEKAFADRGAKIVVKASYPKNTTKVEAAVKAIRDAAPQAVVMISVSKSSALFVKKYRDNGNVTPLYNISVANSFEMSRDAGDALNGIGMTQVMPFPFVDREPVVREYRAALKRYGPTGGEVSYAGLEGFIGAKVLVEAIRRAGAKAEREDIIHALEGMHSFDVGGFNISYSPGNHVGSRFVEITMVGRGGQIIR